MTLSVDLFYSFRSPYSYLALPRTVKLVADYDVAVNLRPVYPLAVRVPGFFKKTNPQFLSYIAIDAPRVAQRENMPYRPPRPDPIVQDLRTLEVAEHQPYIRRVTRLGALAQTEGRSLQFVHAIAPVLWDGSVEGWHEGDHLARAAAAAGFDLPAMDRTIEADPAASRLSSRPTKGTTRPPVIGGSRPSCSTRSRSSARTASTSWSGEWNPRVWCAGSDVDVVFRRFYEMRRNQQYCPVIARSAATKQSSLSDMFWIAALRSQ